MQDLRHAFRQLLRQPGFAFAAILTLALGLGANTAMFSFADGLLLHPLALPELSRLVTVWQGPKDQPQAREAVSAADYLAWKDDAQSFASLTAWSGWSADLTGNGNPERFSGARVSGGYFSALGIRALTGRVFGPDAAVAGADNAVVLSEGFWRRRFAAEPTVIGQSIRLNARTFTVVGVVPTAQAYPPGIDFWVPLVLEPGARNDRQRRDLELLGRLRSGVTLAAAETELRTLASRQAALEPQGAVPRQPRLVLLREHLLANSEVPAYLLIVFLAASFLLALACANVANLEVAQMNGRLREFVIRSALGGGLRRLVRQVMTESLLLCGLGGAAGLLVAYWTIQLIRASLPPDLLPFVPGWSAVGLNPRAFAFAAGAAGLAGVLAGIAPTLLIPRGSLDAVLRQGARGSSSGGGRRLRQVLVVVELALALVLIEACGLVVKTFAGLVFARHGFESDHVLNLRVSLPASRYPENYQVTQFFDDALREIGSLPGVEAVSLTSTLPFYSRAEEAFGRAPNANDPRNRPPQFNFQAVAPDHFRTFRIGLLQGRAFSPADTPQTAPVTVVSEQVARQLWPGESPLGRVIWQNPDAPDARALTVVGVVTEVRHDWRGDEPGTVYVPFAQAPQRTMFVSLRTADDPARHAAAVRSRVQALDAAQPLPQPKPMRQVVVESMAGLCITAGVLTFMGLVSLLVAAAGLYSVVANSVSQRTRELGIRVALGARPVDLLRQVLGEGLRMALLGVLVGLPAAGAVSVLFRHAVNGIPALEAGWFALLALTLLMITLLASYLPARRASRVDPLVALHND